MMNTATIKEIKDNLGYRSNEELLEIILRLARFKKENKELLTYLLFDAANEEKFIEAVKKDMDRQIEEMNRDSYYFIKKSLRRILKDVKRYCRYSGNKETETELLIHFLVRMHEFSPPIHENKILQNLFARQLALVRKNISKFHEDLQYDLNSALKQLEVRTD